MFNLSVLFSFCSIFLANFSLLLLAKVLLINKACILVSNFMLLIYCSYANYNQGLQCPYYLSTWGSFAIILFIFIKDLLMIFIYHIWLSVIVMTASKSLVILRKVDAVSLGSPLKFKVNFKIQRFSKLSSRFMK